MIAGRAERVPYRENRRNACFHWLKSVIVSASRSTDIPPFYSDWFVERFDGGDGYVTRREIKDLGRFGIEHNRCIDDRLIVKCFSHDTELMKFVGARFLAGDPLFGVPDRWETGDYRKDKGQREACGCIMSKDIGE